MLLFSFRIVNNLKPFFLALANEFVMRTCSSNPKIEIEHNLIDLVCLREWKSSGRLCFCEHDRCNDANFVKFEYSLGLLFAFIVFTYTVTNRIKTS